MKNNVLIAALLCASSNIFGMELSAENPKIVKKWPTAKAEQMQGRIDALIEEAESNDIPFFAAIEHVCRSSSADVKPVRDAWLELNKHKDQISFNRKAFTRQEVLTAGVCSAIITQNGGKIAVYLASQHEGIYPHVAMPGVDIGIMQGAADSECQWTDADYIQLIGVCKEKGILPNVINPFGRLPLHLAASHRSIDVVKKVCLSDAWVELFDELLNTPVNYAHQNRLYKGKGTNDLVEYLESRIKDNEDN